MAKNATQSFNLFQLMKAGTLVTKEVIAKALGVQLMSVPVYVHELKKIHKVEVLSVRDGRKVIGYKLITKNVTIPQFRKNSTVYHPQGQEFTPKSVKAKKEELIGTGEVPIIDTDVDTNEEFSDIRDQLGIPSPSSYE